MDSYHHNTCSTHYVNLLCRSILIIEFHDKNEKQTSLPAGKKTENNKRKKMSCMLINALYATFSRSVTTCIMTAQVSSRQKHQSNIRRKDGELQEEDSGC